MCDLENMWGPGDHVASVSFSVHLSGSLCVQAGANRLRLVLLDQGPELQLWSHGALLVQCTAQSSPGDLPGGSALRAERDAGRRRSTAVVTCCQDCHWLEFSQFVEWEIQSMLGVVSQIGFVFYKVEEAADPVEVSIDTSEIPNCTTMLWALLWL